MAKLLYIIGLSALLGAGVELVTCGRLWAQLATAGENCSETPIVEKVRASGIHGERDSRDVVSPLVEQARAYALYLDPPKPPAPVAASLTASSRPVYSPPAVTPKFRLLATTYYRSSPEKSLALVSEPGKGDHWIKKDERLGHFTVERVEKEAIFYRDGRQVREMKVAGAGTVQLAQIRSKLLSTSAEAIKSDLRLLGGPPSSDVE